VKRSVLVAMSGGVDSAVAALLLKEAGHDVVGATMCFGLESGPGSAAICCGADAAADARAVCDRIGIAHHVFDYAREFQRHVIGRFVAEHARGLTPNPCVDCNRFLKFGSLLDKALALGFDRLATGHYARIGARGVERVLIRGSDAAKDQSYFLYAIPRERLGRILFPLCDLTKVAVRELAARAGLAVARKPESQDLCFAGRTGHRHLLARRLGPSRPGPIVDATGRVLGRHAGLDGFTVGQRSGLGVSAGRPLYVLRRAAQDNRLVVGARDDLRALSCTARDVNLFLDALPAGLTARIRHRGREVPCTATLDGDILTVSFLEPVAAVAPGQAVVLYERDVVVGGGTIVEASGLTDASTPGASPGPFPSDESSKNQWLLSPSS